MRLTTLLPYVVLFAGCVSQAETVWEPTTKDQILDRIAYLEVDIEIAAREILAGEKLQDKWAVAASGSSANILGENPAVDGLRQISNQITELHNRCNNDRRELSKLRRRLEVLEDNTATPKKVTTP